MQVAGTRQSEIRETIDVAVELVNRIDDPGTDVRRALADVGFIRAPQASMASVARLAERIRTVAPLLRSLPDLPADRAAARLNEELAELPIVPSIVEHDGTGPHIHWTSDAATFDDHVMADIILALAQELCDHGTSRFGRCGAYDCGDLFFDATRNHSRRFCSDPKCASKTHTAEHRARRRG